jgi:hypothetical protein
LVEAPKSVEASKPEDAPKYVERLAAVDTTMQQPKTDQAKLVAGKNSRPLRPKSQAQALID